MTKTPIRFSLSARASLFLSVLALLGVFAATTRWVPVIHGQEAVPGQERDDFLADTTATPAILLQYASVVSASNTITISRAPVTTSTGATIYEDITLQLAVGPTGKITVASGYPKTVTSPNLLVGSLKAGTYLDGNSGFVLTGPGIGQGVTVWNIATASGSGYNTPTPSNATIWVGPIANNPIAARLKAAKITSTNWSYGIMGTPDGSGANGAWDQNSIIGIGQVGNTLNIACFTLSGTDQNTPVDQYNYTLKQ